MDKAGITEIQDIYNANKTWVIKRTKCRHYYINQKIKGKMFYSRFQRVSLAFVHDIFGQRG